MKPPYPYAHAPRLPESGPIDLRTVVRCDPRGVELEIGPGRGGFLLERLEACPTTGIVGLEIRRKWATIVDDRLREQGLGERGRVFAEDAGQILPRVEAASVSHIYVHFPDPWWKKRHHKRRVVTPAFLEQAVRLLVPGGSLLLQTDVEERADAFCRLLATVSELEPVRPGGYVEENPFGARSPREHRAIADGNPIFRLLYRRTS